MVQGLGFGVWGVGFRVQGLGVRVQGFSSRFIEWRTMLSFASTLSTGFFASAILHARVYGKGCHVMRHSVQCRRED